jgi:thiamine-phosphate pyrophosphorylase
MNNALRPLLPPGLYALCDDGVRAEPGMVQKARWLLEGGVQVMQVRHKRTPERRALDELAQVAALCREAGTVCLVNDRVDWALAAGAHGAHVGAEDLPAAEARRALGPTRILGVTVRTTEDARRAAAAGADYVGAGPVFATRTKSVDAQLLGLTGLEALVRASPLPVVAIAGIGLTNIADVARTGVHGAAVLSDLLEASDVPAQATALAAAFATGAGGRTLLR